MFVRFLFFFDSLFILFRIALWPSVGKKLSPWILICAVFSCFYFSAVLIVGVPLPFGVEGRMWTLFVSVSDHCLFIHLSVRLFHDTSDLMYATVYLGERGGSVVECRTPEREVRGSRPTAAVLCP